MGALINEHTVSLQAFIKTTVLVKDKARIFTQLNEEPFGSTT